MSVNSGGGSRESSLEAELRKNRDPDIIRPSRAKRQPNAFISQHCLCSPNLQMVMLAVRLDNGVDKSVLLRPQCRESGFRHGGLQHRLVAPPLQLVVYVAGSLQEVLGRLGRIFFY